MLLCLRLKGTFYLYRSDEKLTINEKLTITVGAAPCVRPVCRHVTIRIYTHVDVYRADAGVSPYS